jgi:hypothetical protein
MSDPSLRALHVLTLVTAGLLVAVVLSVLLRAYPSTEAVRLRNALLMQIEPNARFDWTPRDVPADFMVERLPAPAPIAAAARAIVATAGSDDFSLARALAAHLNAHAVKGGQIRSLDVAEIYRAIINEGTGYCSDVVDAYIALAHAVGLFTRPWAFSFDGFGGHGHINVEVYDRTRGTWVMLDVFNNVLATDRRTGKPLSVAEFRAAFGADRSNVVFIPIAAGRQRIPVYDKLVEYYALGFDQWYLWHGNNVVSRTAGPLVGSASRIAEPMAELLSVWQGRYPHLVPIVSATNRTMLESMRSLRIKLVGALYGAIALTLLLVLEIAALHVRTRSFRRRRESDLCV